jgi:hypothetical protein
MAAWFVAYSPELADAARQTLSGRWRNRSPLTPVFHCSDFGPSYNPLYLERRLDRLAA